MTSIFAPHWNSGGANPKDHLAASTDVQHASLEDAEPPVHAPQNSSMGHIIPGLHGDGEHKECPHG